MFGNGCHSGRGGGVAAIAIEHHGDAKITKKMVAYRAVDSFAFTHIAPGDKQSSIFFLSRWSGEDRTVNHGADRAGFDIPTARYVIGAAIVSNNGIKRIRDRIGIELEQYFFHCGLAKHIELPNPSVCIRPCATVCAYQPTTGSAQASISMRIEKSTARRCLVSAPIEM